MHPLILGAGARLFRKIGTPLALRLENVVRLDSGVLILSYAT